MKSATVFLLAVTAFTLFLETSSLDLGVDVGISVGNDGNQQQSRSGVSGIFGGVLGGVTSVVSKVGDVINSIINNGVEDKIEIDEAVKQEIYEAIANAQEALTSANKVVDSAVVNAVGIDKIPLTQTSVWTKQLQTVTTVIHKGIIKVLDSGSYKALATISTITSIALADSKGDLAKLNIIIPNGQAKEDYNVEMKKNFKNGDIIDAVLKGLLAGKGSSSSVA